ncbi:MAG: hypothetical protein ABJC09_15350 [Terriglobia bacterium]
MLLAVLSSFAGPLGAQDGPGPAAPSASPSASPTTPVIARLASALSQNNASGALAVFDSGMKTFGTIEENISALTAQNEILCAIDVVEESETDGLTVLDADWYMQLKSLGGGASERRRERVRLKLKKFQGKWKIISIDPIEILYPLRIQSR